MLEIKPKSSEMSTASRTEARGLFVAVLSLMAPGIPLKAAIPMAARKIGLSSERRGRAIHAGEARRIDSHEMDRLRAAAAKAEALRTAAQLDGAAHALVAMDPDFSGPEVERLRAFADRYRALAGTEGEG